MGWIQRPDEPPPTIWEIDDSLWQCIEPILWEDDGHVPRPTVAILGSTGGRALNGIIFRLRSDYQWDKLPKQFGDESSVYRWSQRWWSNATSWAVWTGSGRPPTGC